MVKQEKFIFPDNTQEIMQYYWFLRKNGVTSLTSFMILEAAYPEAEIVGLPKTKRKKTLSLADSEDERGFFI